VIICLKSQQQQQKEILVNVLFARWNKDIVMMITAGNRMLLNLDESNCSLNKQIINFAHYQLLIVKTLLLIKQFVLD
jgi:hypothetical protein